jgi:hypothetical protein
MDFIPVDRSYILIMHPGRAWRALLLIGLPGPQPRQPPGNVPFIGFVFCPEPSSQAGLLRKDKINVVEGKDCDRPYQDRP